MSPRHIVLVGMMGSGKSALGRLLGQRLGRPYLDNDELVTAQTGRDAASLLAQDDLAELRSAEAAELGPAALDRGLGTDLRAGRRPSG